MKNSQEMTLGAVLLVVTCLSNLSDCKRNEMVMMENDEDIEASAYKQFKKEEIGSQIGMRSLGASSSGFIPYIGPGNAITTSRNHSDGNESQVRGHAKLTVMEGGKVDERHRNISSIMDRMGARKLSGFYAKGEVSPPFPAHYRTPHDLKTNDRGIKKFVKLTKELSNPIPRLPPTSPYVYGDPTDNEINDGSPMKEKVPIPSYKKSPYNFWTHQDPLKGSRNDYKVMKATLNNDHNHDNKNYKFESMASSEIKQDVKSLLRNDLNEGVHQQSLQASQHHVKGQDLQHSEHVGVPDEGKVVAVYDEYKTYVLNAPSNPSGPLSIQQQEFLPHPDQTNGIEPSNLHQKPHHVIASSSIYNNHLHDNYHSSHFPHKASHPPSHIYSKVNALGHALKILIPSALLITGVSALLPNKLRVPTTEHSGKSNVLHNQRVRRSIAEGNAKYEKTADYLRASDLSAHTLPTSHRGVRGSRKLYDYDDQSNDKSSHRNGNRNIENILLRRRKETQRRAYEHSKVTLVPKQDKRMISSRNGDYIDFTSHDGGSVTGPTTIPHTSYMYLNPSGQGFSLSNPFEGEKAPDVYTYDYTGPPQTISNELSLYRNRGNIYKKSNQNFHGFNSAPGLGRSNLYHRHSKTIDTHKKPYYVRNAEKMGKGRSNSKLRLPVTSTEMAATSTTVAPTTTRTIKRTQTTLAAQKPTTTTKRGRVTSIPTNMMRMRKKMTVRDSREEEEAKARQILDPDPFVLRQLAKGLQGVELIKKSNENSKLGKGKSKPLDLSPDGPVLGLLSSYAQHDNESPECQKMALCLLALRGTKRGATKFESFLWSIANIVPDNFSEIYDLKDTFKTIRNRECEKYSCKNPNLDLQMR